MWALTAPQSDQSEWWDFCSKFPDDEDCTLECRYVGGRPVVTYYISSSPFIPSGANPSFISQAKYAGHHVFVGGREWPRLADL